MGNNRNNRNNTPIKLLIVLACVVLLGISAYLIIKQWQGEGETVGVFGDEDDPALIDADDEPTDEPELPLPEPTSPKPDMPSSLVRYDTVIKNCRIINPETESDVSGINIGITDGKIAALTFDSLTGDTEFDASGLVVAPGFIDIDSYDPNYFGEMYKISDGVTTNLLMHGGAASAEQFFTSHGKNSYMINYGTSNFVTSIRSGMGYGNGTEMTNAADIQKIVDIAENNLKNGAMGISMSPEYAPGVKGAEMLELCKLAAKYNVTTYYHLRYSNKEGDPNSLTGIQEVIDLAKATGASTHILHISSTGATYLAPQAFKLVDDARASGLDITADIYPYDSWATYAYSARFSAGWQERFGLTYSDLQYSNSTETLTAQTFQEARQNGRLVVANGSIPEHEVRYALLSPYVFIASDTILSQGGEESHHRGAGSYSRTIGKYCREEGIISLMSAIAKTSYLPAKRLESASFDMMAKGRIEIGADADLAIFDYNTIIDTATAAKVASHSEGMKYVFVAGKLVYDNTTGENTFTGEKPGRPVYSYLKSPDTRPAAETQTVKIAGTDYTVSTILIAGKAFVDVKEIARATGGECEFFTDGTVKVSGATIYIGKPDFITKTKYEWMTQEAVIYRGSVYIDVRDLGLFE